MVTKTVDQAITVNKKPVVPAKVTDITVKTQPNKVTYTEDETLNLAGLEVTLKYDDGTSKNVAFAEFGANNITTDPANGAKLAVTNDKVTITYNDGAVTKTVDQAITVNKKPVVPITTQNIEIQTPPNKVTYTEGETLDLTGLVIRLIKSDGSIEDIPFTDFKAKNITTYPENGDILTTADSSIMIIYKEGNVTQIIKQFITVNAKSSGGSGSGHARSHERKDRNEPKKEPAEEPKKEEPKKEQPVPVVPI